MSWLCLVEDWIGLGEVSNPVLFCPIEVWTGHGGEVRTGPEVTNFVLLLSYRGRDRFQRFSICSGVPDVEVSRLTLLGEEVFQSSSSVLKKEQI